MKMTVKEMNKIRAGLYELCLENKQISDTLEIAGQALVYDCSDFKQHCIAVLSYHTQLHDNMLMELGFENPEKVHVELLFTLNRQTKCATFPRTI